MGKKIRQESNLLAIWEAGVIAFEKGKPASACPYGNYEAFMAGAEADDKALIWLNGWMNARDARAMRMN